MSKPSYDFNQFSSIESVAEFINNSPVQGFEDHTPEYLAAAYAIFSSECGEIEEAESHLNFLSEAGAEFVFSEALRLATPGIGYSEYYSINDARTAFINSGVLEWVDFDAIDEDAMYEDMWLNDLTPKQAAEKYGK